MKNKSIVTLALLIVLIFSTLAGAADFVKVYCNSDPGTTTLILLGLPDSPIEVPAVRTENPDDPADQNYFYADYDMGQVPDGSYVLTAKAKNMWGESEESEPYPFVKKVPAGPSGITLFVSSE